MRFFIKPIFIVLFAMCQLANAELSLKDEIRYWQLFDDQNLSLQEIVGTPNNTWTPLSKNQTEINVLERNYWQANRGASMWVKIKLPRIIDSERVWVELAPNVGLDGKMAIYENGVWSWKHAAGRAGSDHSQFPATFLSFAIDHPREHRLVFLKLNTSQVLNFSINVRSHESQLSLLASRNLLYGICFGLMLLAAVYNAIISIAASERVYAYYASYVVGMLLYLFAMTGYNRLAFPEWGGDGSFSNLAACLAMFAVTVFVREFLDTRTTLPKLDILLRIQSSAVFLTIFLLGFISDSLAHILVETIAMVIPIVLLISGISALQAKQSMAKFFILAWSTHIITGSLWVWMWLGFVPPTLDILNIFVAGSMTELLLLTFLLGFNYSNLNKKALLHEETSASLSSSSDHDALTGIYNRQGLFSHIERLMKAGEPDLIWIEINIDSFTEFNTRHGVYLGDLLLSEFGQLLQTKVRRDNLAAKLIDKENNVTYRRGVAGRVNGGQFTIVLSNCSSPQARLYVERLVRELEDTKIKSSEGKWVNCSVCAGVVSILPNDNFHAAWQRATKKLKSAKAKGRRQLAFS